MEEVKEQKNEQPMQENQNAPAAVPQPQVEIVATRREQAAGIYVFALVAGIILTILSFGLFFISIDLNYTYTPMGIFAQWMMVLGCISIIAFNGSMISKFNKMPKIMIVYRDGMLHIKGVAYHPSEIINVQYKEIKTIGNVSGELTLSTARGVVKLYFVDNYRQVLDRIYQLQVECMPVPPQTYAPQQTKEN